MSAVYQAAAARLGKQRGYLVGFLFYWGGWCTLAPLATVGPDGLRRMFAQGKPTRTPAWVRLLNGLRQLRPHEAGAPG